MNRADRKRQAKEDERLLARGIDSRSHDPGPTIAMARQIHTLLEKAKREKNIDPPVKFLQAKVEATRERLADIPVACKKGCSHCCYVWVSATAPEILFVAKLIRRKADASAIAKIGAAHLATRDYDFRTRDKHPHPCPMLEADVCSIYEARPTSCRFAVSMNASVCARAMRQLSGEGIPTPGWYLSARGAYQLALVIALNHAGLPHRYYEFNAGLTRALEHGDSERAWLEGDDIFSGVRQDPNDALLTPNAGHLYRHAFG